MGGISLLALGVRLAFLEQPMRYDEALSFNEFASRPLYYGLSFYPEPNNHLLNTLLVRATSALLGSDPWALRLPALIAGVLLVPATYGLARLLWGSRAGLLAAALVAGSSFLVEYSTNSRGYTLQALCFVVGLCLAIVALQRATPGPLLWLAIVLGLGMYAVPTMLYGIAVIGVWATCMLLPRDLVPPTPRQFLACAVVLALVCVLVYMPVVLISGPERLLANRFVVSLPLSELANELPRSLARTWSFWNRDVPIVVTAVLVVGFAVATVAEVRQRRVPLGLLAVAVCGALLLAQRVAPFERVWLFLLPLFFAVASGGLALLGQRLPTLAFQIGSPLIALGLGFATLTSGSILSSQETGAFPDAEGVARALSGQLGAEDAVLTQVPASLPELQYYFPRNGLPTQTLVRPPEQAVHLYVVASADSAPLGIPAAELETVAQLPGSVVYRVRR